VGGLVARGFATLPRAARATVQGGVAGGDSTKFHHRKPVFRERRKLHLGGVLSPTATKAPLCPCGICSTRQHCSAGMRQTSLRPRFQPSILRPFPPHTEFVYMRTVFKKRTENILPIFLVCLCAAILATFGRNTCSRVISVLDSGAEGAGFRSLSGNSLRQIVHTHCASVHQAAKLVAALLRVAGVTAGLPESNSSLPPGL